MELADAARSWTVLGADNQAWTDLGRQTYFELLAPASHARLERILRTHLLPRRTTSLELFRFRSVRADSGVQLFCSGSNGIGLPGEARADYLSLDVFRQATR